jgi:hypothetical protein
MELESTAPLPITAWCCKSETKMREGRACGLAMEGDDAGEAMRAHPRLIAAAGRKYAPRWNGLCAQLCPCRGRAEAWLLPPASRAELGPAVLMSPRKRAALLRASSSG